MRRSRTLSAGIITILVAISVLLVFFFRQKSVAPEAQVMVRYESAKHALEDIVKTDGPRAALDRLIIIASSDKELAGLCHGLSHEVGHAAQEILGFTGALAIQDDVCGSGYVHGIIEQELSDHIEDFESRFKTLCPSDDARCFHGLGHGLMYVTRNDLPTSLKQCRTLRIPFQRIQCAEGVFMENFEADSIVHPSSFLFPDDPYRTCRDQPEPEKGVCSFYFPRYFLHLHPSSYANLFLFCTTLPKKSATACIKGGGSAVMKAYILEPEKALAICLQVAEQQRSFCIDGLLSYMTVHYASTIPTKDFCDKYLGVTWSAVCEKSIAEGERAYNER